MEILSDVMNHPILCWFSLMLYFVLVRQFHLTKGLI